MSYLFARQHRTSTRILAVIAITCMSPAVACGPSQTAKQTDSKVMTQAGETGGKRYPLTGRVVSFDKANQSINVDGDAIPGFMGAMTMAYQVKDHGVLEKAAPGDRIKAEIVVGNDGAYLENIVLAPTAPSPNLAK